MYHEQRFTVEKILKFLKLIEPLVYRKSVELPPFKYKKLDEPLENPLTGVDVDDNSWQTIEPDSYWGEWLANFTIRTEFNVPKEWDMDSLAALYLPMGEAGDFSHPEALAYIDDKPYASCDRHHQEIILPDKLRDGKSHLLALNGWTGLGGSFELSGEKTRLFMRPCRIVLIDEPTREFAAVVRVTLDTVRHLDKNNPMRFHLLNTLNEVFKRVDTREPFGEQFYLSIPPALDTLRNGIADAGPSLGINVVATGHSHIDVAWLWTLGQTRKKIGRTFHTVIRLMEQYPDYHFTQSQPQLYDYMRQDYPELFESVKKLVKEGRWEVIGGMWVEADCNISGPESLARQFLLGRTFFREHFGPDAESPVLWLPDVFGYSWSLPQLIKEAGLNYFFTIKIGWSQYNRLPYDTFRWQGIDGTKVLTHFSTTPDPFGMASTYNAAASVEQNIGTWNNFQQKELGQDLLMAYGYGDGGGGPTREMLENLREMKNFPGMPKIRQKHVGDFYRELEDKHGDKLPTWNGELYLELHRGTYTTQSRNKRANRKSEFLLHDAEFLAVMASLANRNYTYPADSLKKAWEIVCLNQFHDIIPGSSISDVYRESLEQYVGVRNIAEIVSDSALIVLMAQFHGDIFIINPSSFTRNNLALLTNTGFDGTAFKLGDGTPVTTQETEEGILIDTGELAPYSITPVFISDTPGTVLETGLISEKNLLENQYIRIEINDAGDITRILDKHQNRELLSEGEKANQFQAFEDRPLDWDAWDVFIYYDDKMWESDPASCIKIINKGPLRATLEIKRRILNSEYVQRISLDYNSPRIDFDTSITWNERHILLKVAFPVDILSPKATYEIQWGNVERPTHRNTSWDWARFETCAQKWVDLSEGGYGVSLLNDCKYGHDIKDNVMRISLLRGSTSPDPEADLGEHRFAYSLFPHAGACNDRTCAEAYSLNDPLIVAVPKKIREEIRGHQNKIANETLFKSLIRVNAPNVIIETVKAAEDGKGIIVRLYESQRCRGQVLLKTGFDITEAWRTNLLEENRETLAVTDNEVAYNIRPFEIVTMRLVP